MESRARPQWEAPRLPALRLSAMRVAAVIVLCWLAVFMVGCDRMANSLKSAAVTEVKASTPAEPEAKAEAESSDTGWVGKTEGEVKAEFGKPQFAMHTGDGVVWHYPRWLIQFDVDGKVVRVERDVTSASRRPANSPETQRKTKGKPSASEVKVTRISNGGAEVDLGKVLKRGKVTIVDFYADWCGPCRQIAPHLERMAKEFDVELVKIDIVRWGTPVARQMNINSVPNIWVFDKNLVRVGSPTHDLQRVQRSVLKAKTQ